MLLLAIQKLLFYSISWSSKITKFVRTQNPVPHVVRVARYRKHDRRELKSNGSSE